MSRYQAAGLHSLFEFAFACVGSDKGHFPQLHIPYESMKEGVLAQALPISELKKINSGQENKIDQWLRSRGYDEQTAKFQPLKITASKFAVLVDAKTAKVIGISTFNA